MPLLVLDAVPEADRIVVRLTGEADLSTRAQLDAGLRSAAGPGRAPVLIDVAGLRFADCPALGALACFTADLARVGRGCRLVGASPWLRRLLGLAGLAHLLEPAATTIR